MADFTIDLSELKKFSAQARRVSPELQKSFVKSLNAGGEIVAAEMRRESAFSTRIPSTVTVRRRGTRVRVQAGGADAPGAAALNNRGRSGTFRHPVFGNKSVWVDQQSHPFAETSVTVTADLVQAEVGAAVGVVLAQL